VFAASQPKSCAILLAPPAYVNRREINLRGGRARRGRIFDMAKSLIVSAITALLMILLGVFWMLMWLVGTNGYSESKGTAILASNLVLVILSIIVSSVVSGWLANMLATRLRWPMWAAGAIVILGVLVAAVIVLFTGSLLIIAIFGRTR
jgi:predicted anti-sigma-YlaC factor YlaD